MRKVTSGLVSPDTGIDLGPLPDLLGYQLRLTQIAVFEDFAHTLTTSDITPGRFSVLLLVGANPGIIQSRLAQALRLDRSSMVPLLDQMERLGLVERKPDPGDRRSNCLWLTPHGESLLAELKQLVVVHEQRICAPLSPEERTQLQSLLLKVREACR